MRVRVSVRADGSLLSCDIWLLTEGMAQPSVIRQANHERGCEKKKRKRKRKRVEDTEGPGHV